MHVDSITDWFATIAKLGICGLSIVAIAWTMLWVDSEGGVEELSASIITLEPTSQSDAESFRRALEHLGHSPPRSFNYNGNDVYFSSRTTRKSPHQLLREYQRTFVQRGINEKIYEAAMGPHLGRIPSPERAGEMEKSTIRGYEAMMSGQLVPIDVGARYVSLGGGVVEGRPETRDQARRALARTDRERFAEVFEGYRYIEAFRQKGSSYTAVTAVWSGEDFETEQQFPGMFRDGSGRPAASQDVEANPETTLPPCPSCRRSLRFGGHGVDRGQAVDVYASRKSISRVAAYYHRWMVDRGWERTDNSRLLGQLSTRVDALDGERRLLEYRKKGDTFAIELARTAGEARTRITAFHMN